MATTDIFRTMIVPADKAAIAQEIAVTIKPVEGQGMWTSPFSPDGQEPATHYISTGYITNDWLTIMPVQQWEEVEGTWTLTASYPGAPGGLQAVLASLGSTISLAEITALFTTSDVTEQDPWVAIARLGLQPVPVDPSI